ncbi:MAG TPA: hypothetical protein VNG13_02905 [Mycobacteriales bacterium]|nr:hypothetical protein [Mycobacteriales bacterium]
MTPRKERLTVTVDPELVQAGNDAVHSGLADSLSAWVNEALSARVVRDRQLQALAAAIADFESQFGEITAGEMAARRRADDEAALVVRGRRKTTPSAGKPRGHGAA